jgi:dTDP-4-dehydrorhamnose reductase
MPDNVQAALPERITTETALEELLSRPDPALVASLGRLEGDLLILGVAGKMGPTLARMARRALDAAGNPARVIGVSRFSSPGIREQLEAAGVQTLSADLLDRQAVAQLPDAPHVILMAGRKFGSTGGEPLTWAMNAYVPALVAERYRASRIVAFSTGNVYDLSPVSGGGSTETTPPHPIGEYAQSCLGRERILAHFAQQNGTPMTLMRLNYAVELRYGILLDVARQVFAGQPIDLTMGNANVIWQGDANRYALRCLELAANPPTILNVTGPEIISIRAIARQFGELFGVEPRFQGQEADTALLNNAARAHRLFGYPYVPLGTIVRWVAHWVSIGGATLDKPTHFQEREGKF